MPISVNWWTRIIFIPQSYLTAINPPLDYELDVNTFRLDLKDLEDDEGMPNDDTHTHTGEVTIGGVTYSRFVEIINGYMVEFEDGMYAVNLTGANNNIVDVKVVNMVSVRSQNSAGLITVQGVDQATLTSILNLLEADEEIRPTTYKKLLRGTSTPLLEKTVTPTQTETLDVKD
jgi:hypothetical protein